MSASSCEKGYDVERVIVYMDKAITLYARDSPKLEMDKVCKKYYAPELNDTVFCIVDCKVCDILT